MSKITSEDVRKVAHLARLKLPEELISTYTKQLEKILDYVAQLEKVDTKNVIPTTRAVEVVNITREDRISEGLERKEILDLCPEREGDFYKVPKILDS